MTLTAILPVGGRSNGSDTVRYRAAPRIRIDVGLECSLELLHGVAAAREVAVAHEERLVVVIGVDHPERDTVGLAAAHLSRRGVVDVHAVQLDLEAPAAVPDLHVRLAEHREEVARAGLERVTHEQLGVHPHEQHLDATELALALDVREALVARVERHPVGLGDCRTHSSTPVRSGQRR